MAQKQLEKENFLFNPKYFSLHYYLQHNVFGNQYNQFLYYVKVDLSEIQSEFSQNDLKIKTKVQEFSEEIQVKREKENSPSLIQNMQMNEDSTLLQRTFFKSKISKTLGFQKSIFQDQLKDQNIDKEEFEISGINSKFNQ